MEYQRVVLLLSGIVSTGGIGYAVYKIQQAFEFGIADSPTILGYLVFGLLTSVVAGATLSAGLFRPEPQREPEAEYRREARPAPGRAPAERVH